MPRLSEAMQLCIRDCQASDLACSACLAHCLEQGGPYAQAAHVRLLIDCAAMCRLSADFMARGSSFHQRQCSLCEDVCVACAESCEGMPDDPVMAECAALCRRCADSLAGVASL